MKKMRYFLMGLFCALTLAGCAEREERSYLHTFVTEEQTLLRGDAMKDGEKPTPEDISYFLAGTGVEISMEDYAFEEAEENAEGNVFSWTSYLQDDTVHIFVAKRAYLDELLHVSPAQ